MIHKALSSLKNNYPPSTVTPLIIATHVSTVNLNKTFLSLFDSPEARTWLAGSLFGCLYKEAEMREEE